MTYEKRLLEEEALQIAATKWLRAEWGYEEVFSDVGATGARMDSAGVIRGRAVLIEVKTKIGEGMSDHTSYGSGSLESKVAGALGPLYRYEDNPLSVSVNNRWDRRAPPIIAFLASRYNESGASELQDMLQRRSNEWLFDWRIWQWDGRAIVERASYSREVAPDPSAYASCDIARLKGGSKRSPNRTLDELVGLAAECGVQELFDVILQHARPLGYRLHRQRGGLGLARMVPGKDKPQLVLTAYIDASSAENGLKVGYWPPQLLGATYAEVSDDMLPGVPTKGVFAAEARFLLTPSEVRQFLEIFAPV